MGGKNMDVAIMTFFVDVERYAMGYVKSSKGLQVPCDYVIPTFGQKAGTLSCCCVRDVIIPHHIIIAIQSINDS
jgi:hypothetical protein